MEDNILLKRKPRTTCHGDLVGRIARRGVQIGAQSRGVAVLDYDQKGITSSIRLSPHYYNTEEEIDACVDLLAELVGAGEGIEVRPGAVAHSTVSRTMRRSS